MWLGWYPGARAHLVRHSSIGVYLPRSMKVVRGSSSSRSSASSDGSSRTTPVSSVVRSSATKVLPAWEYFCDISNKLLAALSEVGTYGRCRLLSPGSDTNGRMPSGKRLKVVLTGLERFQVAPQIRVVKVRRREEKLTVRLTLHLASLQQGQFHWFDVDGTHRRDGAARGRVNVTASA